MRTRLRQTAEGPLFPILIAAGYAALAGLLVYGLTAWSKPEIEVMLPRLYPKVLWANLALLFAAALLCLHDLKKSGSDPNVCAGAPEGRGSGRLGRLASVVRRPGVGLAAVVLIGLLLVTQVAPQVHRIYYDEDIYANMAQNIAHTGQAGMANYGTFEYGEYLVHWLLYNKDPSGWPFLMSLVFLLFGVDETYAFYLNNLLFAGGIAIVFAIARLLGSGPFGALVAALVYALIPHNLLWAATISAENAAAVFGGLVVLCTLLWLRTRAVRHLFLLAAVAPLACVMRPESGLVVLWAGAAVALNLYHASGADPDCSGAGGPPVPRRHPLATRAPWALGLIAFALVLPLVWHFHALGGQSWGAAGPKFALAFLKGNLAVNGPYYFNNREFPLLFTLLALAGLAAWLWRPAGAAGEEAAGPGRRAALLMPLWFFLFWTIFLFFYAGSYKYGADVRFALTTFMPLAVLAGRGAEAIRRGGMALIAAAGGGEGAAGAGGAGCGGWKGGQRALTALLVGGLVLAWVSFLPLVRTVGQEAWGARYDHRHARAFLKEIPERAIVLTHVPTMFLLWGQNAIQAYAGINNPDIIQGLMVRYDGHVYFHKGYWCNTASDANRAICEGIGRLYEMEPVAVAREQTFEYGLYRLSQK